MSDLLSCIHFRAYKSSCLNDGKCPNRSVDEFGHKYCTTRGFISVQTSINIFRYAPKRRDNGD
jgi:DNA-directed RNA polymerase subunit N (RpoN/RPB10)